MVIARLVSRVRSAFYIATAVLIVGCGGFSLGGEDIGGDEGVAAPTRRVRDGGGGGSANEEQGDASTASTPGNNNDNNNNPTNPATDGGATTTNDAGTTTTGPLKAFVSSAIVTGGLGGVAGADKICSDLAKAAGLAGTYKAWISTTGVDAIDRITADGPWQRVDGQVVAQTKAQLAQAALSNPLRRDEKGTTPPEAEDRVWTATGANGRFVGGSDCAGWTGAGNGRVGEADDTNADWTSLVDEACTEVNRVYCFQNQ